MTSEIPLFLNIASWCALALSLCAAHEAATSLAEKYDPRQSFAKDCWFLTKVSVFYGGTLYAMVLALQAQVSFLKLSDASLWTRLLFACVLVAATVVPAAGLARAWTRPPRN